MEPCSGRFKKNVFWLNFAWCQVFCELFFRKSRLSKNSGISGKYNKQFCWHFMFSSDVLGRRIFPLSNIVPVSINFLWFLWIDGRDGGDPPQQILIAIVCPTTDKMHCWSCVVSLFILNSEVALDLCIRFRFNKTMTHSFLEE